MLMEEQKDARAVRYYCGNFYDYVLVNKLFNKKASRYLSGCFFIERITFLENNMVTSAFFSFQRPTLFFFVNSTDPGD